MADTTSPQQPLWQRILDSQRFKMTLINVLQASGVPALPFVQKWFPDATVDSIAGEIIMAVPFVVGYVIHWYRDNPDNFLARARKVLNGGTASPQAVAAVATTAQKAS